MPRYAPWGRRTWELAWFSGAWLALGITLQTQAVTLPPPAERQINFSRDIQPILTQRCAECHGPKRQESGLRLDQRSGALAGGERGPAVVSGNSAASLLVQAVAGTHTDIPRMPKKGDALSIEQIGLLRAWIDQGAVWPVSEANPGTPDPNRHWAFRAPVKPPLPQTRNTQWPQQPIDRFILARLEAEGLEPSAAADRITLLRRLSLDLVGLPPSIEDARAFLEDPGPDAYERVVERLLASPHYGERWGRHWLDAARYADSDGFEKDKIRWIWNYRDWVVRAFNEDLPYNEFIIDQLAGDLRPNPTQDQRIATGFLRNSMINEEGGVDPEQFRMDAMFDRMDAIGKSVLGLTIQCGQCHNHKYDPLTQDEYYRLFAFLNNDHEANEVVHSADELRRADELARQIRDIETELQHRNPDWEAQMARWEESARRDQPDWVPLSIENAGDNAQRYVTHADRSLLAGGYAPTKWTAPFDAKPPAGLTNITAFRLELLTDPNLPCRGPGRSILGTCALSEFTVEAGPTATNRVRQTFASATADYANPERALEAIYDDRSNKRRVTGPVQFAIDNQPDTAWGIDAGPGRRNQDRKAVFVLATNLTFQAGIGSIRFGLQQNHGGWNSDDNQNHNLGRFRISATSAAHPTADPLPARVRQLLAVPKAERTPAQVAALFGYWRTTVAAWAEANQRIEALWAQWPQGATTLMLAQRENARDTRVLRRGDWLKPSRPVTAGVPAFLHPLKEPHDGSRMALARWLTDRNSPTTARAMVNRVWQAYFGTGLLDTPEDFGLQASTPSHPELLDWLACEFMDCGWSFKQLHRLIVHSATYKQHSRRPEQLQERDPYNRLLARGARLRVEAEIVRDLALASSGLLNTSLGGPSVFSPSPAFLYQPPASYGPKIWTDATASDRYRRGLYTHRYRSVPYPMLQNFDAPNGDSACVRRSRSNTPLQALTTLNEPVFVECAQALATRVLQEGGATDQTRLRHAFQRVLTRPPTPAELSELERLLERQRQRIADGWMNAAELGTGKNERPASLPPGVTPTQLAAYTVVARVLLNLDEAITKE
jgi:hypothetical protein